METQPNTLKFLALKFNSSRELLYVFDIVLREVPKSGNQITYLVSVFRRSTFSHRLYSPPMIIFEKKIHNYDYKKYSWV